MENGHILLDYPEVERVAYLAVVAAMAQADNRVTDEERANLTTLCRRIDLDNAWIDEVLESAETPNDEVTSYYLTTLRKSTLRYALLTDLVFMAYADRNVAREEEAELTKMRDLLGITRERFAKIEEYVVYLEMLISKGSIGETERNELARLADDARTLEIPPRTLLGSLPLHGMNARTRDAVCKAFGVAASHSVFGMIAGFAKRALSSVGWLLDVAEKTRKR